MADRRQLIKYLRFQLEVELSVDNGQHTFEHICREVARMRLASNLIPATGPVGGGGDAGRDFETFKSYLPKELGEHSAFVARMSDKALAFACTLQKEKVESKFAKDVETILNSGDKFEHVYAMCAIGVDVGRRNRLRNKVKKAHGIDLTLLDGEWLAEHLADHDLFWVAEAYLSVPADMAPPPEVDAADKAPDWYAEDLEKWRERGELRPTLGDLLDAKDGLRYASFFDDARQDLEYWLLLIEPLTAPEHPREVRQRARYEYSVAALKGSGELRRADAMVRAYLTEALSEQDAARLQDANVLLTYAVGAWQRNVTDLDAAYLRGMNDKLRCHLRAILATDQPSTYRARVLQTLGNLGFQPDVLKLSQPGRPEPVEIQQYIDENGGLKAPVSPSTQPDVLLVAVDEGMAAWAELTACLEDAPLFPVDDLAQMRNLLAPLLAGHERWRQFVDGVDEAVRRTTGDAAVAEGARDRAMRLHKAGRLREAVGELHAAKANWWSGDNLEGSLLAMLLIADIYRQLRLMQASKQYALAVSASAAASGEDHLLKLVARGLFAAAQAEYFAGAWCGAADLFELGFRAVHQFSDAMPDDDATGAAMFNFASLVRSTEVLMPDLKSELETAAASCGMKGLLEAVADILVVSAKKYIESADEELSGRPFADVGAERVIRFKALGLDWTVRCVNAYEHVLVAERFVAAAQVLLVELAEEDLCLLPTSIDVRVEPCAPGPGERATSEPSNEGRPWSVKLLPEPEEVVSGGRGMPAHDLELLTVLSTILLDASLLPRDAYMNTIDEAFRRGLSHKLGSGRPYDELAAIVTPDRFDRYDRKRLHPPADPLAHATREHPQLAWQTGPGPTYSQETADEMNTNRYEQFAPSLRVTLPRLLADAPFRETVARLRAEGWKDWDVLVAVASRTQSLRVQVTGYTKEDLADPKLTKRLSRAAFEPEDPTWPQPPAFLYTHDDLVWARKVAMLQVIKYWRLELRQRTPDFPAIERLLAGRYGYWSDDVVHHDALPQVINPPKAREPAQKKTRARRS